jgi:hypothetical protein
MVSGRYQYSNYSRDKSATKFIPSATHFCAHILPQASYSILNSPNKYLVDPVWRVNVFTFVTGDAR